MDPLSLALLGAVIVLGVLALAPRVGVSAPLLLVGLGVALSFLPSVPDIAIDPEIILVGLLPPLLYATSVSLPAMDFRRDLGAIGGLSIALVIVTSVALGFAFSWLLPDLGLAGGIALGAVVSPTDAVATSIVRKLGVTPRVVTVLEGESLINDASALVLLRSAIAATAASVSLWEVMGDLVYAVAVAVAIGWAVGRVSMWIRARVHDEHLTSAISFTVPFLAYLPAEHLHASGLVSTVVAGLVTGVGAAKHLRPQDRLTQAANWKTIEMLIEGAVFLAMGLQVRGLVHDVEDSGGSVLTAVGLAALAVVVVLAVRALFVTGLLRGLSERFRRRVAMRDLLAEVADGHAARVAERLAQRDLSRDVEDRLHRARVWVVRHVADVDYLAAQPLRAREGVLLTWAGMRGVVTVAAAQTLPADIPHRSLLLLVAFTVAAGTLLIQGGTLGWVVRRLGVRKSDDDDLPALVGRVHEAAFAALERGEVRKPDGTAFDDEIVARAFAALDAADGDVDGRIDHAKIAQQMAEMRDVRLALIDAQRRELLRIRDLGTASSSALNRMLARLDADQIGLELRDPAS